MKFFYPEKLTQTERIRYQLANRLRESMPKNARKEPARPRTAKAGDICILAEPAPHEISDIRRQQKSLQSLFGGRFHSRVHLTCQRFTLSDDDRLPQVIQYLRTQVAVIPAFKVWADSLVELDAPFWSTRLLRWQTKFTLEVRQFCRLVDEGLKELDIEPHFQPPSPTQVTALEDMVDIDLERGLHGMTFPKYLFTAQQAVLSKISGPRDFEILETIQFSSSMVSGNLM